jgi:hypothetical protein
VPLRPPTAKRPKPCAPGNASVGPLDALELEREELDKLEERELELSELERELKLELSELERELEIMELDLEFDDIELERELELIELNLELELIELDRLDEERDVDEEILDPLHTAPATTGFSAEPPFFST